jgi:SRSO17 transposase
MNTNTTPTNNLLSKLKVCYVLFMAAEISFPGIDDYLAPYAPYFRRLEGRELAHCYVVGLMMEGERKSVEPMSERVQASERGMQRLLTEVKWDYEGVLQAYRRQMLAETSDPQGILLVDDTSFPKKGRHSVCVSRQYCGALGKVANCQVGVSLTYVGQEVSWPYAMDLFVPPSWDHLEDPQCVLMREKTRMPPGARHREKWQMALDQIELARQAGVPHRAVAADAWYGHVPKFRQKLSERGEWYVVGVYANTEVFLAPPVFKVPKKDPKGGRPPRYPKLPEGHPAPVKVSEWGLQVEEHAWEHLELRRDSRGQPLVVEAVSRPVWPAQGYRKGTVHEEVGLIIERRWQGRDKFELRYFFSNMPQNMPTLEMVRLVHERFWIEQGYQQLKQELGLDHHEGRSWIGWHRHVLLVFLAYGYLTRLRLQDKKPMQQIRWTRRLPARRITERQTSD